MVKREDGLEGGMDAAVAQAGVDLPLAFAHEERIDEHLADGGEQIPVGHQSLGPALLVRHGKVTDPLGVDRGTRNPQFDAYGDEGMGRAREAATASRITSASLG